MRKEIKSNEKPNLEIKEESSEEIFGMEKDTAKSIPEKNRYKGTLTLSEAWGNQYKKKSLKRN